MEKHGKRFSRGFPCGYYKQIRLGEALPRSGIRLHRCTRRSNYVFLSALEAQKSNQMFSFHQKRQIRCFPATAESCWRPSRYLVLGNRTVLGVLLIVFLLFGFGCSRQHYRLKADKEAYGLLKSETNDPRWKINDYRIGVDRRSRMFDIHDPDCEPMPSDDPAAARKMRKLDGKKCTKRLGKCGCTHCIENPRWRQFLLHDEGGAVVLTRDAVMELALLHSPEYQAAKENLYLSALRVSQERFRFDVQFFGSESLHYTASGRERSSSGTFLENDARVSAEKLFATGGELVVGIANSITWTFAGPDNWYADSLINVGFVQPLLRGAGRRIILENLTQTERDFLAAVRRMAFYQQGFYTRVVGGGSDRSMPQGWGEDLVSVANSATSNAGFLGLLADQIRIQNQRQNIVNIEGNLQQIEEFFRAGKFDDRLPVEQMLKQRLDSQSLLVQRKASYLSNTETFLRSIGLPPDLKVKITDPIVESFELMSPSLLRLQEKVGEFLNEVKREDDPLSEDLREQVDDLVKWGESELGKIGYDLEMLEKKTEERLAGFQPLRIWANKEIQNGERLDPSIYNTDIYLRRIVDLKNEEDTNRFRAALTLLKLFVNNDEPTIRTMFENRTFDKEILDALILLELTDLGGTTAEESNVGPRSTTSKRMELAEEDLLESREKLQLLQEQLKTGEIVSRADELTPKAQTAPPIDADDNETARKRAAAEVLAESDRRIAEQLALLLRRSDGYRMWLSRVLNAFGNELIGLSILQTRIRLDCFTLTPTEISTEDAFRLAEQNRLDWMNQRASLVDQWRQLEIAANRLKGDLKLTVNGELGTIDKNGVRFDADNSTVRMGLQWDSPMTRHSEMLAYRRSQIAYQRARRNYYTYVDSVNAELRLLLRDIEISQIDFEIQRNSILAMTSQVHLSQFRLIKPPQGGGRFNPTLTRDLTDGLQGLLDSQNRFLEIWIKNQTLRMQLDLLMGTMQLDERGNWIDPGPIRADRSNFSLNNETLPFVPPSKPLLPPKLAPVPLETENSLEDSLLRTPLPLQYDGLQSAPLPKPPTQRKLTSQNAPLPPQTPE